MSIRELLLVVLFITIATAFTLSTPYSSQANQCKNNAKNTFQQFQKALEMSSPNGVIDGLTQLLIDLPTTLNSCFGAQVATQYSKQMPPPCIHDLGKAGKILVRMANQTDNDFKLSIDAAVFEKLYETKLKKECPILQESSFKDVKSGGICLEAAYKQSLIFQQLYDDLRKGDKKAIYSDVNKIAQTLPDMLDACGESALANKLRKLLALNCVHSVQALAAQLVQVQQHYMHLEWVAKHYKQILKSFADVKANCPL